MDDIKANICIDNSTMSELLQEMKLLKIGVISEWARLSVLSEDPD